MALTDLEIKRAKARDKACRMSDGSGLYLWIGNVPPLWSYQLKALPMEPAATYGVAFNTWSGLSAIFDGPAPDGDSRMRGAANSRSSFELKDKK
jgi:hypothetical protein